MVIRADHDEPQARRGTTLQGTTARCVVPDSTAVPTARHGVVPCSAARWPSRARCDTTARRSRHYRQLLSDGSGGDGEGPHVG